MEQRNFKGLAGLEQAVETDSNVCMITRKKGVDTEVSITAICTELQQTTSIRSLQEMEPTALRKKVHGAPRIAYTQTAVQPCLWE